VTQAGKTIDGQSPIRVLGLSGSLRQASYNTALLRAAQELAPEGTTIEIYDLSSIPMYNDDVRLAGYPDEVVRFRDAIRDADAVLIASPEYNRSVPGVLKNAIDWASRRPDQPFAGKPLAIVGVSNGALGAAFANHHLRQIFVFMDARMVNGPEVMVGGAKDKFDAAGNLVDDATRSFVADHLAKLASLVPECREAVGTC
jgi:chromate reductase, NAD(P)H dehydrogenase (quinone)